MIINLARILKAERGEEYPVLLLFGKGFFMGIYLYSYKIVSEAIFLSRLGEYLDKAMFVSAALGVVSAFLFSYYQNRISFSKLSVWLLFIIFTFLGSIRFLHGFLDDTSLNVLIFISFIMIQPIFSVALLNFWGIFGRIFDLRQSKRIIAGIDSGQLLAALITSLSIPLVSKILVEIDFLFISLVALFIDMGILFIIISKFDLEKHSGHSGESRVKTRLSLIMKDKYVIYLSLFLLLSIISFQFVHFSFLSVTEMYYPTQSQLVSFLGYFNACIMVLSLIIQTFVNERLIATYGLKTTLLVLPVILGIFTFLSMMAGTFFGYDLNSSTFIWFFLFIVLSKLFHESLRESLETPSFKLFFMPLDIKIRFDIQAKVEGVINEFSRLIAGVLIVGFGLLSYFELIHYSIALSVVLIAWIWSTSKLYTEYRNNVKKKLQGHKADFEIKQKKQRQIKNAIDFVEEKNVPGNVIFSLKLIEKWDNNLFRTYVGKLITAQNKFIRRFALDKMNEQRTVSSANNHVFRLEKQTESSMSFARWFDSIGTGNTIDNSDLTKLLKSENREDRKYLADFLATKSNDHGSSLIIELLNDLDDNVKSAAIKSAATAKIKETYPILIENLKSPKFADKAVNAFVEIGEEAFPNLDSAFYKSGQNIKIMMKILQIYGKIGGKKAMELLWDKIDFPDKKIIGEVLHSLGECDFLADESQVRRIKFAIESDLANIAWNLKALESIPEGIGTELLIEALTYDIKTSVKHIFMLLTMLYETNSIQLVQENLFGKTGEGLTYAIELLDVFLSDDLKEKIIFMLDDVLESKELNKLQNYYPQNDLKFAETLRMLINRDYNLNNRWTKACAVHYIGDNLLTGYEMDLIANLFNPDGLIRETAAWSIYQLDPNIFRFHINRLDLVSRKELEAMIGDSLQGQKKRILRYDKVWLLANMAIFKTIPHFVLSNVVEMTQDLYLKAGDEVNLKKDMMAFGFILYNGELELITENQTSEIENGQKLIGGCLEFVDYVKMKARTDCLMIQIEKDKIYDYLSGDPDLILSILDNVQNVSITREQAETFTA